MLKVNNSEKRIWLFFIRHKNDLNCLGQFREIPWNQATDVHRGSTLITRR